MINNNKNIFNIHIYFWGFFSKENQCIFEIKKESLVIYEMWLFKTILFNF